MGKAAVALGALLILIGIAGLLFAGGSTTTVVAGTDGTAGIAGADPPPSSSSTSSSTSSTSSATTTTTTTTTSTTSTTTSTTTTTTTTSPPAEESVEEFFDLLLAAFASGDADTLFARLNQVTLDRYGADQCETYAAQIAGQAQDLELVSSTEVGDWDYVTDDVTDTISDTTAVAVVRTLGDQTIDQELHWKRVDGAFTWFTDCGVPA